jgi:hypothetical protein
METKKYLNDYVSGSCLLKQFKTLPKGFHQSYSLQPTAYPKENLYKRLNK